MAEIKVPFHKAAITKDEEDAVLNVLRSGWLTTGRYSLEFEKKFSAAVSDTKEMNLKRRDAGLPDGEIISLAVNSNTSGMILASMLNKHNVTLLERNNKLGKKLLLSDDKEIN